MPFGSSKVCVCKECDETFSHAKKLSEHFKKIHKLMPIDYAIKHTYHGTRPLCAHCAGETRFVSVTAGFKKYCAADRKVAESEMGKIGGKTKRTWNKGKTKETDARIATLALKMSGEGNAFFGHHHDDETLKINRQKHLLTYDEISARVAKRNSEFMLVTPLDDYVSRQEKNLTFKCTTCGTLEIKTLQAFERGSLCKRCHPGSIAEKEIANFVQSLGLDVIQNSRSVISPKELDVLVPEKNVAIEHHGLYWHSGGKTNNEEHTKLSHRDKYAACQLANVRLFQFFSDEWRDKREICESMIRNALGKNEIKFNARDCVVREVTIQDSSVFLDDNHISGRTRSRHHIGLFHETQGLVGVATTRIPIQKKWGNVLELARMCFKNNTSVRGGASKLLSTIKRLAVEGGFEGVLSYAELRYGEGHVYEKCGFDLVGEALNNYWYSDGHRRHDRFKFRAQPNKSEKQVCEEAGVAPVWGCGNKIYLWHPPRVMLS